MDILGHILNAGLPVLAILAVFAAWAYAAAMKNTRRG